MIKVDKFKIKNEDLSVFYNNYYYQILFPIPNQENPLFTLEDVNSINI